MGYMRNILEMYVHNIKKRMVIWANILNISLVSIKQYTDKYDFLQVNFNLYLEEKAEEDDVIEEMNKVPIFDRLRIKRSIVVVVVVVVVVGEY